MAVRSNISIIHVGHNFYDVLAFPIGSSDVAAPGDLINHAGNTCEVYDAVADADTYAGVCADISRSGDTIPISVYLRAVVDLTLASAATLDIGDGLIYSAGDNGTDWTFAADTSGTNIIAWAFEQLDTSGTGPFLAYTDSFQVSAGRVSGDGLWEAAAT